MVAVLSGKAPIKGLAVASFGLMLSLIGSDPQTGTLRWTFGSLYLWDHLPLVPVTLGIFALPELAEMAIERSSIARTDGAVTGKPGSQWDGVRDAGRHWWLILRCSGLGALLGAVPGIGSAVIDWMAYGHAIRTEKNPENFGKGDIRGVIAAESSNNAKEGGHLIPTVAFGMPAGASMALLLSAFIMHGFTPGPEMLTKHLDLTYAIIWTLTLSHIMGAVLCLSGSSLFSRLATVRVGVLIPIVLGIIFLGAFNTSQSWGDLCSMTLFGFIGWLMKRLNWPRPPLILGLVLGSIFERYYFISNEIYGIHLFTRPIVVGVLLAALWVVLGPSIKALRHAAKQGRLASGMQFTIKRLDRQSLFTIVLICAVVAGIWSASDWAFGAKLMPMTAASAALVFSCVVLIQQVLARDVPRYAPEFLPTVASAAASASAVGLPAGAASDKPAASASRPVALQRAAIAASAPGEVRLEPATDDSHAASMLPVATARARGLRFFVTIGSALALAWLIGLLPSLLLMMLLLARFEFGERWRTSIVLSVAMTVALWLVFDRIFATPWPPSLLGDCVPALRALGGLV
jgi:putative tricarboxylic transport membrane protein